MGRFQVASFRKSTKSRTRSRKSRSNWTKAKPRVASSGASQAALIRKLKAHAGDLEKELEARTHELAEARRQQAATSEVLRVISGSPGELQPVFEAMLANATRVCGAKFGTPYLYDGDAFHATAFHNAPPEYVASRTRTPLHPPPDSTLGRAARTRQIAHVVDSTKRQVYRQRDPFVVAGIELGGYRTIMSVPMLKEDKLVGVISIYRQEVRPFSEKQIEVVQNFASQAVIAIENTRLLKELRRRTDDLSEALEQQTAASEVLRVISSSPGELEPVFQAVLASATRTCEAKFGFLYRIEGDSARIISKLGIPPALAEYLKRGPHRPSLNRPGPLTAIGRVVQSRQTLHIADYRVDPSYLDRDPMTVASIELGGIRTLLVVPMIKNDALVGAIVIFRQEVRPFTEKQIELVKNFANQAVIAIENARLLNELRQRTNDLTESLQQQTATADVLKVISSSPGKLEPVFDAMLENAVRICEAKFGMLYLYDGDEGGGFRVVAAYNVPPALEEARRRGPIRPPQGKGAPLGDVIRTRQTAQVADLAASQAYAECHPATVAGVELGGVRTLLIAPMLKEGELVGAFSIFRQEVRPFTDKHIELVENFAAQAAIAIENTRLLNELRESLQQQTATADVLKVISRSSFDLQAVLQTLVESAGRLCDADFATITRQKDGVLLFAEAYGYSPEFIEYLRALPVERGRGTATGRALLERRVVHIADVLADPDYTWAEAQRLGGYRTVLGVPMLREGIPVGVLTLTRSEVRPFTDKQIELVSTFADQAAIAIENVRLFDEINDKSRQLEIASLHKSQFLANMSHELRTPLNAILGYNELMLKNIYGETTGKMSAVLTRIQSNGRHLLRLINDVLDLSKIEAGQLTLSFADYSIKHVVHSVRAAVEPLATEKRLAFKVEVPPDLPTGCGDERRLIQVLLNLVSNAIKFTDVGEVTIKVSTANGAFTLSVRDTGPGIDPADQIRIFEEFQQADSSITKKKGGTGLGLSIARHIIEMHGGRIWVESSVGKGATFFFTVPVRAGQQVGRA
jgi:two-component system, NtrC family, sensor kinase